MSVNHSTLLTDNSGSNLRLIGNRVDIQNWRTGVNSNLPLSTQLAASNYNTIMTLQSSNINVTAHIIPTSCNVFDLGHSNFRFRDLYLSGNTIDIDGLKLSKDATTGGLSVTTGANTPVDTSTRNLYATGNIGVGTTNPQQKLHVVGNIFATGTVTASNMSIIGDFVTLNTLTSNTEQMVVNNAGTGPALKVIQSGANVVAEFVDSESGSAMFIANGGNVGIGTTNPTTTLHVQGNATFTRTETTSHTLVQAIAPNVVTDSTVNLTVGKAITSYNTANFRYTHKADGATSNYVGIGLWGVDDVLNVVGSGTIGIGTTAPSSKLHVYSLSTALDSPNNHRLFINRGGSGSLTSVIFTQGGPAIANGLFEVGVTASKTSLDFNSCTSGVYTNRATIQNDGNVGIGLTNPSSKLEVSGSGTTELSLSSSSGFGPARLSFISDRGSATEWRPGYIVSSDNGTYTGRLDFYTNGTGAGAKFGSSYAMSIVNGNVGIGTTTPVSLLHVNGTMTTPKITGVTEVSTNLVLRLVHGSSTQNTVVQFGDYTAGACNLSIVSPVGVAGNWSSGTLVGDTVMRASTGSLHIAASDGTSTANMVLNRNGNVGIGFTNPQQKLEVNGIISSTAGYRVTNANPNPMIEKYYGTLGDRYGLAQTAAGTVRLYCAGGFAGPSVNISKATSDTDYTDMLTVKNDGNVGIGTANPGCKFAVNGGATIGSQYVATAPPTDGLIVGGNTYIGSAPYRTNHIVSSGLTRYWNFQNTLTDLINSSTFTVTGSVSYVANTSTTNGDMGMALATTGVNYLSVASPINQPPFSICFWFYPQLISGYQRVISIGNGTTSAFNVDFDSVGNFKIFAQLPNFWLNVNSTFNFSINTWYHIGITVDASYVVSLYINGSLNASGTGTGQFSAARTNLYVAVNADGLTTGMNANYDDLRIYGSRAITATEVSQIYNAQSFAGNVGIGTATPLAQLHVTKEVAFTASSESWNTTAGKGLYIRYSTWGGQDAAYIQSIDRTGLTTQYPMEFFASRYGFWTGNVGIGTITPGEKLEVSGSVRVGVTSTNTIGSSGNSLQANSIYVHPNSTTDCMYMRYNSTAGHYAIQTVTSSANGGALILNPYGGNIGIGTTTTNAKMHVNGSILMDVLGGVGSQFFTQSGVGDARMNLRDLATNLISFYYGTTKVGSITTNGTTTTYNQSSDYRLKENIVPLTNAIDKVAQLQPKKFNFKTNTSLEYMGFLAHEVQPIVPYAVTGTKDEVDDKGEPKYQQIDHSTLVPLLTAAIKELHQENIALRSSNQALFDRIGAIEAKLNM